MSEPQSNVEPTPPQVTKPAAPKKPAPPPVVRMDRSRDYATVTGERAPDDPWAKVFYQQNGLPFDASGHLIHGHFSIEADPKLKARAEKLVKEALKRKQAAPGDDADSEHDEDADGDDDNEAAGLNLEAWARGEQDVLWQRVSDAMTRRWGRRFTNKRDALEFLIAEGVVAMASLSKTNKAALRD